MITRFIVLLALMPTLVAGQTNVLKRNWSPFVRGGSVYQFDTGLDGGGSFSLHRYYIEGGLAYLFRLDRMVSVSAGYGQDDYHFRDLPGAPWNNIDNFRIGLFSRWAFDNAWSSFAAASGRTYGDPDADLSDAMTGAVFGGASYRFSDRLSLGPGLGIVGQLDDGPSYFPILVVDWDITERLNLATGSGLAATAGPGLSLTYSFTRNWKLGLVGRYEQKRFRLSEKGIAPGGVGEDRSIPLYGSLSYVLYPGTQVSGLLGMHFDGRLRIEDAEGSVVSSTGYGNTLAAGITLQIRL